MSKMSKLINHPGLFFKDMLKKRFGKKPEPTSYDECQIEEFFPYRLLLHTGEGANGITHLNLWIPHFKKSGVDFIVLVRNYEVFEYVKQHYDELPIVFAKGQKEVNRLLGRLKALKACFYPSNTGNNLHLLAFNHLTHIFIGHGDSDKTASAHKYFRVYDQNWVAGQAHIDRFDNAGFDHRGLVHIKVGRPNLKETLLATREAWQKRYDGSIHLLYLSTWEGVYKEQDYTSVYFIEEAFKKIIDLLIENFVINAKPHPWVGKRDKSLGDFNYKLETFFVENEINGEVYSKDTPVEELIKESNVFICDISAVVSESLAGNGPIFVYIPKDKPIKLAESKMGFEDYCYTYSSVDELIKKFKEVVVEGNDYLSAKREEAKEYIIGYDETMDGAFVKELQKIGNHNGKC